MSTNKTMRVTNRWRLHLIVVMLALVVMTATPFVGRALGQHIESAPDQTTRTSSEGIYISSAIAYAAIAAFSAVGGSLVAVIRSMWTRLEEQAKLHHDDVMKSREDNQKSIDALRVDNQKSIEALRADYQRDLDDCRSTCRKEMDELQERLVHEQAERRTEVEKLLREQQTIMREVMSVCGEVGGALRKNTEATEKLIARKGS